MYAQFAQSQAPFLSLLGGLQPRRFQATQDPYTILAQLGAAPQFERAQFDAGDQQLIDSYARRNQGVDVMPNTALASPPAAQQPARRNRVSGWRVLDRVLGGDTISEGLDAERVREQQLADAPSRLMITQENERIARALGPQALLAFRTNPEAFGESLGYGYRPQVVAEGAAQRIAGSGDIYNNRRTREWGDSLVRDTDSGYQVLGTRGPTISERNASDRLAWDRQYGTANLGISQQNADTSRLNAETTAKNSGFSLGPGQVRYGPDGSPIASVAASPSAAVSEINTAVAGFEANNERFRNILTSINGDAERGIAPAFDLSPANALRYEWDLARGANNPAAAAYGNYKSEIEAAVSDALRLNVGPQTDQDAIREARALLSNINNRAYVNARLPTVIANNERLARARMAGLPQSQRTASASGPIAEDANGNRIQWNGQEWVPIR